METPLQHFDLFCCAFCLVLDYDTWKTEIASYTCSIAQDELENPPLVGGFSLTNYLSFFSTWPTAKNPPIRSPETQ